MGRRKTKRKPPPKRKNIQNLEKQFDCPLCNHELSCNVLMDKQRNLGRISCKVCKEFFQTAIIKLSDPIDVFNDWLDACEANK